MISMDAPAKPVEADALKKDDRAGRPRANDVPASKNEILHIKPSLFRYAIHAEIVPVSSPAPEIIAIAVYTIYKLPSDSMTACPPSSRKLESTSYCS